MSTQQPQTVNPLHQYRSAGDVSHSKENALTEREFELLLEGARTLGRTDYYRACDPPAAMFLMGRLGLRRGELVHMQESWIDWRRQRIQIPAYQPCDEGMGGGICGDCIQSAQQRVEHNDELTYQEALDWMWTPKTEAGVREIYFGHSTRAEMYLERYFASDEYDRFEPSGTSVARRCTRAADIARELDPETVHPHGLRATAATQFVADGLGLFNLCQVMGWVQLSTGAAYISRSSVSTAKALEAIA